MSDSLSVSQINSNDRLSDNEQFRDNITKARKFLCINDETIDDEKILRVFKRLKEFVQYFVHEFETKLNAYFMVIEKCKQKAGKYADTLASELGQGGGAIAGFLLGYLAGQPLTGAKYGGDLGRLGGKKLGEKLGTEHHEKNVAKAMKLVLMYHDDKPGMRKLLVEIGFDIFQSFEMQFTYVEVSELGPRQAMLLFARDAVNRAVRSFSADNIESISESVMLGQSKRGFISIMSPGYDVIYASKTEKSDVKYEWKTASLYEKAGLIREENDRMDYYKNKESKTEKYGYRRPLQWEDREKLFKEHELDLTDKNKVHQFQNYAYILDIKNIKQIIARLFEEINLDDEDLSEKRLIQLIEDSKIEIVEALKPITEQICQVTQNHKLLQEIISVIESFHFTESVIKEFKKLEEGMREYFKLADRKSQIYAEENRAGHRKTLASIEDGQQTLDKIYKESICQTKLIKRSMAENRKRQQKVSKRWEGSFGINTTVTFFTGRGQQLKEITDNIRKAVVVICGLSGIGKSELAVKYAGSDYNEGNSVILIDATTRQTAQDSFRTFAKDILRKNIKDRDGEYKSLKSIVMEVYDYFANGQCLFIFDNAEKYSSLEELLPIGLRTDPSKYSILVTSQNHTEWIGERIPVQVLPPLNGFTKLEATEFLKKTININSGHEIDDESLGRLAEKLHNFPLFLKHIAEYIKADIEKHKRRNSKFNVLEYITLFDVENKTNTEIVSKIWQVTFKKLEGECELAIRMVQLMAYFESNNIPEEIFSYHLTDGDVEKMYDVTGSLEKYCIVNVKNAMLSIHALIQKAIRLKEQSREEDILEEGLGLFKVRMASDKSIKGYIPHIISLWNYASKKITLIKRFIIDENTTSTYFRLIAENSSYLVVETILDSIENHYPDKFLQVINAKGRKDKTPLHYAIRGGNECISKLLIHKGAEVNAEDVSSHRPLHLAARYGLNGVVKALLETKATVNAETSDKYKFTALHLAAQNGHKEVVGMLLRNGADHNGKTQYKFTSLQLASKNGHLPVVNILLDQDHINIENKNDYNLTALHLAAQSGHFGVVQVLLYKNADVNVMDGGNFTPLHLAAQKGFVKVVNELLSNNKINIDAQTTHGNTPLHLALENNRITVVRALIDNNAKCDIPNEKGFTAFELAAERDLAHELKQCTLIEGDEKQESNFDKTETSMDGQIYEIRLLEWLLLNGLSDDVYGFNLASNMQKAHKLDDIVFKCRYKKDQNEMLIFLQAKHRSDSKLTEKGKTAEKNKITINQLFSRPDAKKADFSLIKYFDSFLKIRQQFSGRKISDPIFSSVYKDLACDVIVYTNAEAAFGEGDTKELIEGIEKIPMDPDHILNFSKTEKSYFYYKIIRGKSKKLDEKIDLLKEISDNEDDIMEFLTKLKLFIGQPHQNELGCIIKEKIRQDYKVGDQNIDSVFSEFELKILTWWNEENEYLTKDTRFLHDALRISFKFNVKEPVVLYTGRQKKLSDLHEVMKKEVRIVLTQEAYLGNLGGVGKTQFSRRYADYYSKEYDENILCIDATNNLTLEECFHTLANEVLKIKTNHENVEDNSINNIILEVYKFFVDRNRKCLFIFDNVSVYKETECGNDSVELSKFLPKINDSTSTNEEPRVLIISRDHNWSKIKLFPLNVFVESDAMEFINRSMEYKNDENINEVRNLAIQVKGLPLALRNALAYIKQENRSSKLWDIKPLTISDYLKIYEKKTCPQYKGVSAAIFKTWAISVDRIKEKRDGKSAIRILNVIGYLPASNIQMDNIFSKLIENQGELQGAVELLSQYALLNLQYGTLEIHRYMQEIIRKSLEEKNLNEQTAQLTYNLLRENFPPAELDLYVRRNDLLKLFKSYHVKLTENVCI